MSAEKKQYSIFELVQVHESGNCAEVVIRDKNGSKVYAGNLDKMDDPRAYYAPDEIANKEKP